MVVLPSGFALPPLWYTVGLVSATIIVATIIVAIDPPIDQKMIVALAPWMAVGGALHAFYQLGAYPATYEPLFGTPAVYLTTFVMVGLVWAVVSIYGVIQGHLTYVPRYLGLTGLSVLTVMLVVAVREGITAGTLAPVLPAIGVIVALVTTALTVLTISIWRTPIFLRMRYAAPMVVFAHALDGVTTAIGADVLGVTERSPLPRAIMNFAATLPVPDAVGVGWLFLLVKLALAGAVVVAFNRYVRDEPAQATVVLSGVVAVGLGPATNNLFLFMLGAGA